MPSKIEPEPNASLPAQCPAERGIYSNRTLNLRGIRCIGYDMDYTLVHYREDEWEARAYEYVLRRLLSKGWPVESLSFEPRRVSQGLTMDLKLGNLVKANRFGYVIKASHGTSFLDFDTLRKMYSRTTVDLSSDRYVFMNTTFSISEACLFGQLVELFDARKIDVRSYAALYEETRAALNEVHMQGELKAEIIADPERYVVLDPEMPLALLDQFHAGKKLVLVTNSEWEYTRAMMQYTFDRFLPEKMTWRDLFDLVIVSARKPGFFAERQPLYEVVDEEKSHLTPALDGLKKGGVFFGGHAGLVEEHLGLKGDEFLYVGDHLFGDVHVSKAVLRWRTALILRELEAEIVDLSEFAPSQAKLATLMQRKEQLEQEICHLRVRAQRIRRDYGPSPEEALASVEGALASKRGELAHWDDQIAPIAKASANMGENDWGPLMRAGNDKSLFARQVERYADVYTSRVSNFLFQTPFGYLRAPRGSLPHDPL